MNLNPLGKKTEYKPFYDPSLLYPISRKINRESNHIDSSKFDGYDIWNCYELSWLNKNGKPEVGRVRIVYPSSSGCIVESKSLKLYLGSFIMSVFGGKDEVAAVIKKDLSFILQAGFVFVDIFDYKDKCTVVDMPDCLLIDNIDVVCRDYKINKNLLVFSKSNGMVCKKVYSNLLKTNCPITGQPDWATVYIEYRGDIFVSDDSLLKYIVSYREHGDYHEACCEKIFTDLYNGLNPVELVVKCFFTRRGGIDINPCRFFGKLPDGIYSEKYWRQ